MTKKQVIIEIWNWFSQNEHHLEDWYSVCDELNEITDFFGDTEPQEMKDFDDYFSDYRPFELAEKIYFSGTEFNPYAPYFYCYGKAVWSTEERLEAYGIILDEEHIEIFIELYGEIIWKNDKITDLINSIEEEE